MKAATRILPWSGVLLGVSLFVVWLARPHLDGRSLSMPTRAATTRSAVTDVDGSVTAPLESRRSIATPIDEPGFFKRIVATLIGRVDVFGVVVDPAGAAVPSAIVRAKPDPTAAALDFEGAVEVRADQTGRFRLRLPAGTERVALLARADDVARGIVTLRQLGPPSWGRLDVGTVILGRRPGITGRIVDAEGRAVAGARIVPSGIRSFDEAPAVESRSLPDGTFELPCVGEGAPTPLIVSHPDYGLAIGAVARCGGEPATIVLLPSPLVHGHVRDESGSPVAGARVEALGVALFEIPRGWVDDMRSAATNADGEYRLRLVPMDDLTLMVTAFGCSRALREFSLRDGSDEEVDLALRHVGTVSGVVIDAVTGEPIEGAIVSGAASEPTPTNRAGRFVATLPDRESDWFRDATEVRLDASKPGYVRNATTLSFDDVSHEARIKLRPAARVRGLVLDPEGHPLDDAIITAAETEDWHHANTGVDGTFVFDTLRPGRYTGLWVSHPTYPRLMLPGFEVREGETREVTCIVGRGRAVCGRVVARATGAPIANANVAAWRWDKKWFSDVGVYTNARGEFSIRGLFDAPTWLVVNADGFAPGAIPVELPAPPRIRADVELTLGPELVVEGDALDDTGAPLTGTWVHVSLDLPAPFDQFFARRGAKADACGHFRIGELSDAPIRLGARFFDMRTDDYRVAADRRLEPPFDSARLVLVATPWPLPRR